MVQSINYIRYNEQTFICLELHRHCPYNNSFYTTWPMLFVAIFRLWFSTSSCVCIIQVYTFSSLIFIKINAKNLERQALHDWFWKMFILYSTYTEIAMIFITNNLSLKPKKLYVHNELYTKAFIWIMQCTNTKYNFISRWIYY